MLMNESFEDGMDGWETYHVRTSVDDHYPESNIERLSLGAGSRAVKHGDASLRFIGHWFCYAAGVRQSFAVTPNSEIKFSAWAMAWCRGDNEWELPSEPSVQAHFRVGIDPTGGTNALANTVQWTNQPESLLDVWRMAEVAIVAISQTATVFVEVDLGGGKNEWPLMNMAAFIDECAFTETPQSTGDTMTTFTVKPMFARARAQGSMAGETVMYLNGGQKVNVTEQVNGWGKLSMPATAWIHQSRLLFPPSLAPTTSKFKLAPLVNGGSPNATRMMREAKSPVIELVGGFSSAHEYANLPHKPLVIGRNVEEPTFDFKEFGNPKDAAREYIRRYLHDHWVHPANKGIHAWIGPNEPVIPLEMVDWYAKFEAERTRIARTEHQIASVVGNWSTGWPPMPNSDHLRWWRAFKPAMDAIEQYDGYLGLHEYGINGDPQYGFLLCRYRNILDLYPNVKIVITECGTDAPAWQETGFSVEQYATFLATYNNELMKDSQVIGATIFTLGVLNEQFARYSIEGTRVVDLLLEYANSLTSVVPNTTEGVVKPFFSFLRSTPASDGVIVGIHEGGKRLTVVDRSGAWCKIELPTTAWIAMNRLT